MHEYAVSQAYAKGDLYRPNSFLSYLLYYIFLGGNRLIWLKPDLTVYKLINGPIWTGTVTPKGAA
jgi:hypothetical protein